jgi:hypothetical protein
MPLIRVRVRPNDGEPGSASAATQAAAPHEPSPGGGQSNSDDGTQKTSGTSAFVAGALVGLFALAVVSAVVLVRGGGGTDAGAEDAPDVTSVTPVDAAPAIGEATSPAATMPADSGLVDTRTGPSAINPEFNLEDPIAYVNDSVIAMRDLDRSVRIARVLAALSGEPVPANDAPEFRDFQIKMLKRLVDLELMAQGVLEAGLPIPEGDTGPVVDGFLQQVGATRDQLDAAMAAESVTPEELHKWFSDARTAQYFVTESLAVDAGADPAAGEQLTADWLKNAWATKTILINFYEPES